MAQFSHFLDLPAELRHNVYQLAFLLPETLHVTLTGTKFFKFRESFEVQTGKITKSPTWETWNSATLDFRKISFEQIVEVQDSLVVKPFSMSKFRINRAIYTELQHLFYTKSTWHFNSLDSLIRGVIFLPDHVRMKIRRLGFTMMAFDLQTYPSEFPLVRFRATTQQWTVPLISSLLQLTMQLKYLRIRYSKPGMLLQGVVTGDVRYLSEGHIAACAVAAFVWPGLTTSFLYCNSEMTADLMRSMMDKVAHVEWRSRGQDRYCTPLAELLIRPPPGSVGQVAPALQYKATPG